VDVFFDQPIEITPRAMAAFQSGVHTDPPFTEDEQLTVFEHCIMETLMRVSPACWSLLEKSGVNVAHLPLHTQGSEPGPLDSLTLDWIFRGVESTTLTPSAERIAQRGVLDDVDLLTSNLEASLHGSEYTEFGGSVLKSLGLREPNRVRSADREGWIDVDSKFQRLVRSVETLRFADPSHSNLQLILYADDSKRLHIQPFAATNLILLDQLADQTSRSRCVFRDGMVQPLSSTIPGLGVDAVERFEDLLNSEKVSERDFQLLFEDHPILLTGVDFKRHHSQPILYKDDGSKLIPDFFLEKMTGGLDAIVDLKLPNAGIVARRPNRTYFKQGLQNAIAQLRFYQEWFESPTNRRHFQEIYGVTTFRPKMVVVMGRRHNFIDDVERIRLTSGLSERLDLWTYDDLLARAKRFRDLFVS
jgi:hypothetical protein